VHVRGGGNGTQGGQHHRRSRGRALHRQQVPPAFAALWIAVSSASWRSPAAGPGTRESSPAARWAPPSPGCAPTILFSTTG
jgi:hypothetical protein